MAAALMRAIRHDFTLHTIPTSREKLISELGVLTHPRVGENTVSKDDDPRFYHEMLKAARYQAWRPVSAI